jgi:hypothetical protein
LLFVAKIVPEMSTTAVVFQRRRNVEMSPAVLDSDTPAYDTLYRVPMMPEIWIEVDTISVVVVETFDVVSVISETKPFDDNAVHTEPV